MFYVSSEKGAGSTLFSVRRFLCLEFFAEQSRKPITCLGKRNPDGAPSVGAHYLFHLGV